MFVEPQIDSPAMCALLLGVLLSCHVPPGGLTQNWKVVVATKAATTNSELRVSPGESLPFLNLKNSVMSFFVRSGFVSADDTARLFN